MNAVHTIGVNWAQIGSIIGGVAGMLGVVLVIIGRISANVRGEIQASVQHLAEVLDERLATKQDVAELTTRIAVLEATRKELS
jgi:hypothetical protein